MPIFQRPSSLRDWDSQRETDLGLTSEAINHRRSATGNGAASAMFVVPALAGIVGVGFRLKAVLKRL